MTVHEITTGAILGGSYDPQWFYVRENGGDWEPTYADYDSAAHGRLMNFRMINAVWDNPTEYGAFDPDANTADFIDHLAEYKSYGLIAFTIGLQGGNIANSQTAGNGSAFNDDGTADLDGGTFTSPGVNSWWYRLQQVIEACDDLGLYVIVNIFYFGQDDHLDDNDACRTAVEQTAQFLIDNEYRNTLCDVVNEWTGDQYLHSILDTNDNPDGVAELIEIFQDEFTGLGWQPPAGASLGGVGSAAGHTGDVAAQADVVFPHGNGSSASSVATGMAWHVANQNYPVVMNEDHADDHTYSATQALSEDFLQRELDGMQECWDAGGSWGGMLYGYNQAHPMQWDVGATAGFDTEANYFKAVLDGISALVGQPNVFSEYSNVASATTESNDLYSEYSNVASATTNAEGDTLSAAFLSSGSQLFAADITATASVGAVLLASIEQFFNATLEPGVATVAAALLASTVTLYAADITASASIAGALLASTVEFFNATLEPGTVSIDAALLATTSELFVADIDNAAILDAVLLASTAQLFEATLTAGGVSIGAALLAAATTLYNATVSTDDSPQTLNAALLAAATVLHEADITSSATLAAAFLAATSALYEADITASATINSALLDSAAAFYGAELAPGGASISAALLAAATTLYAADVSGEGAAIAAALLAATSELFEADITTTTTLSAALLSASTALYEADLNPGTATLSAALLGASTALYEATVAGEGTIITAALLAATSQLFTAVVTPGTATISAALLAAASQLYAADFVYNQTISAALLASAGALYTGTVGYTVFPRTITVSAADTSIIAVAAADTSIVTGNAADTSVIAVTGSES